jgi:hypothetical protein
MHVYVQLYEFYPAGIGKSQFIQNRRQPLAVASPRGVKLQQHRASKTQNLAFEHAVRDLKRAVGVEVRQIHPLLALAADGRLTPSVSGDTILRATSRTLDNKKITTHSSLLRRMSGYHVAVKT